MSNRFMNWSRVKDRDRLADVIGELKAERKIPMIPWSTLQPKMPTREEFRRKLIEARAARTKERNDEGHAEKETEEGRIRGA